MGFFPHSQSDTCALRQPIQALCVERATEFWNTAFIKNHHQARAVSCWVSDGSEWDTLSAKLLALLEVWLGGTGIEEILEKRKHESEKEEDEVRHADSDLSHDMLTSPRPWDSSAHASLTAGTLRVCINDDYAAHKVLIYGDFTLLAPQDESVFAYNRAYEGRRALVVLNFTAENDSFALPDDVDQREV
ncbi:hypothetical protein K438DRAFT_1988298 [Mycena galopus ATCC 62051]|nr:hypothetical protein K438DRAFT_1988298 [Mycena galopus ATCC 62051]